MKLRSSDLPVSPAPAPWDIDCSKDVPLVKQEFADDCDINKIIARCVKSNLPLPSASAAPLFADVSEIGSYDDCVRRVAAAKDAFMDLPADLRSRFDNEPSTLISFLADPANVPEAIKLGLLDQPKAVSEPAPPAPVAAPAAEPTK
ncbi:MAG: internal scaffolding protein [Microvirus sp.]|nr:MAG: internal scaffolding protein [Microvirus sp.]